MYVGVEVLWFGKYYTVRCTKEVILSSGTIGSPHILMHSGIGPANHLKEYEVLFLWSWNNNTPFPIYIKITSNFEVILIKGCFILKVYSTKGDGPLNLSGEFYWGRNAQIQKIRVFWKLQILAILKLSTIYKSDDFWRFCSDSRKKNLVIFGTTLEITFCFARITTKSNFLNLGIPSPVKIPTQI